MTNHKPDNHPAGALTDRLEALAVVHDQAAARCSFRGNEKYKANPQISEKRRYHEQAAADIRRAAASLGVG